MRDVVDFNAELAIKGFYGLGTERLKGPRRHSLFFLGRQKHYLVALAFISPELYLESLLTLDANLRLRDPRF